MEIFLTSPNNVTVELATDVGGSGDDMGIPDSTCDAYIRISSLACDAVPVTSGNAPFLEAVYMPEGDMTDFHDDSNPLGEWMLQICDDASTDIGILKYVELVFAPIDCPRPEGLQADSVGAVSANLSWASGNNCLQTIIEYGPPGFTPGIDANAGSIMSQVTTASCPVSFPYVLTGLLEQSAYDVYIRKQCVGGGFSPNSCPIMFVTDCQTLAPSIIENFDIQATCATTCGTPCAISGVWHNSTADDFDWIIDKNGTPSSRTGPDDDISGGSNYAYVETSGCFTNEVAILMSECISVSSDFGNCHMSFYYFMYGDHVGDLSVDISNNTGLTWQNLWTLSGAQGEQWFKQYIDLSAYHGDTVQFRIIGSKGNGVKGDIGIDEIVFYGSQTLGAPSNVFYRDNDGDGYGNDFDSVIICKMAPPAGYADNNLDCADNNANIHPGAQEIICNGIDENCNGINDDLNLPNPTIQNDTACAGGSVELFITSTAFGGHYWYIVDSGGSPIYAGDTLMSNNVQATFSYFVWDSIEVAGNACVSERVEVQGVVFSQPDISVQDTMALCMGDSVLLSGIVIEDTSNANGVSTFHTAWPPNAANQITSPYYLPTTHGYTYIVYTAAYDCFDTDSIFFKLYDTPEANINPEGPLVLCSGRATELEGIANTDGLDYTVAWSNGFTDSVITIYGNPIPGSTDIYVFSVADENMCIGRDSVEVFTTESISQAVVDNVVNVSLCNGNNGSIQLSPLNGVPPYTYQWEGPVTGDSSGLAGTIVIDSLSPGSYRVTITDNATSQCPFIIPVIIVNGPSLTVTNVGITDVTCAGDANGSIALSVIGTGSVSYAWSNGDSTASTNNLSGGLYSVTISDDFCDVVLKDIEVYEPEPIVISNQLIQATSCVGEDDGLISLVVTGGTNPYLFNWNNSETSSSIHDLTAGSYSVTISDLKNCLISDTFFVPDPIPVSVTLDSITHVNCFGESNGAVYITPAGGNPPYTQIWSNTLMDEDLTDVQAGTYWATIMDANSCAVNTNLFEITEPDSLFVHLTEITTPTCNVAEDGSIEVAIGGGVAPHSLLWNDSTTGHLLQNAGEGAYYVTLTDDNGCTTISDTFDLQAPELVSVDVILVKDALCQGIDDGEIQLDIDGGITPYSIIWSNGDTTQNIAGLAAGDYTATVTDANGCYTLIPTTTIQQPQVLNITFDFVEHIACHGDADGQLFISTQGGTAPYNYMWNDSAVIEDRQDLDIGTYYCIVTDTNGCLDTSVSVEIVQPDSLIIDVISIEDVICAGQANGSIDISVTGGELPYLYSWDNASPDEDLTGVPAGTYKVTILDKNSCAITSPGITVQEPAPLEIELLTTDSISCNGNSGGGASIAVTGGIPDYIFLWSNDDTTQNLIDVPGGKYAVTVTDAANCVTILTPIEVIEPTDSLVIYIDSFENISCYAADNGYIKAAVEGGTAPYQILWNNANDSSLVLSNLEEGNYQLTITDNNGCVGTSHKVQIIKPELLTFTIDSIASPACATDSSGHIFMTINGGTTPYSICWINFLDDTLSLLQSPDNLPEGDYYGHITDANGCTATTQSVHLPGTTELSVKIDSIVHSCVNAATGGVYISISGGEQPYQYFWSDGTHNQDLTNAEADLYFVTIIDNRGCAVDTFITIENNSQFPLSFHLDSIANVACKGDSTGSIHVYGVEGTAPYKYNWSNGSTNAIAQNLAVGAYNCIITDWHGCTYTTPNISVSEPPDTLVITVDSVRNTICRGDSLGAVFVSVTGATQPISYLWNNNVHTVYNIGVPAGNYQITVTDGLNCVRTSEMATVVNPPPFDLQISTQAENQHQSNGSATVSVNDGGTAPYSWQWDLAAGLQTTETATNLESGTYSVTLSDANDCDTVVMVTVDMISPTITIGDKVINFNLYPNPTDGRLYVEISKDVTIPYDGVDIQVLDVLGRVVDGRMQAPFKNNREVFDFDTLRAGMYYMVLRIGAEQVVVGFVRTDF